MDNRLLAVLSVGLFVGLIALVMLGPTVTAQDTSTDYEGYDVGENEVLIQVTQGGEPLTDTFVSYDFAEGTSNTSGSPGDYTDENGVAVVDMTDDMGRQGKWKIALDFDPSDSGSDRTVYTQQTVSDEDARYDVPADLTKYDYSWSYPDYFTSEVVSNGITVHDQTESMDFDTDAEATWSVDVSVDKGYWHFTADDVSSGSEDGLRVSVFDPSGSQIASSERVGLDSGSGVSTGVQIPESGTYTVHLEAYPEYSSSYTTGVFVGSVTMYNEYRLAPLSVDLNTTSDDTTDDTTDSTDDSTDIVGGGAGSTGGFDFQWWWLVAAVIGTGSVYSYSKL